MRILLVFTISLLFGGSISGQVPYTIEEDTRSMSQGVHNALILSIETNDVNLVEDLWKDYLKDYNAKPKRVKGSDETMADDAEIPGVGAGNTVDVYALIEELGGETQVVVWFNLGGAYLNSKDHPSRFEDGQRFLDRFVLLVSKDVMEDELDTEESRLKDIEKELDQLEKEKKKLEDEIADAEEVIRQARESIRENEQNQKTRQKEIETQQKVIEAVKKRLKDLD